MFFTFVGNIGNEILVSSLGVCYSIYAFWERNSYSLISRASNKRKSEIFASHPCMVSESVFTPYVYLIVSDKNNH